MSADRAAALAEAPPPSAGRQEPSFRDVDPGRVEAFTGRMLELLNDAGFDDIDTRPLEGDVVNTYYVALRD